MTDTCPECGQSRKAAAVALQYIRTSDYWFEHAQLMEAERDTARANLQEMIDTENVLVDEAAEYDRLARVAKASRAKWQARALALRERVKTLEAENASAVAQIGDLARRCTDDTEYLRERVAALEAALASVDDDYTLEADR